MRNVLSKKIAARSEPDERAGTAWLAGADAQVRLQVLADLLSRFNHDLRTPLNTILGWTHLLQQGAVDSTRSKHVADVIARNSREQTALLEDFVDDGRALLGKLKAEFDGVRLDESLSAAIERAGPVCSLHAVTLQPHIQVGEASVAAEPRRLQRLFYRLLVVVARRGRENGNVTLSAEIVQNKLRFSVAGIAHDENWSDAALLDLRISAAVTALFRGSLEIEADSARPVLELSLPLLP